jgi:hypothetical protein
VRIVRREEGQLRTVAYVVAGIAVGAALREANAPRLPVAPAPRPVVRD